jgi:hypothetical protein
MKHLVLEGCQKQVEIPKKISPIYIKEETNNSEAPRDGGLPNQWKSLKRFHP